MSRTLPIVVLLASLSLVSCGVSEGEVLTGDETQVSEGALTSLPLGMYVPASAPALDLFWLELEPGGTYSASRQVYCFTTPCNPIEEHGTYRTSRTWSGNVLTLTTNGGSSQRYLFGFIASALVMRDLRGSPWYVFYRQRLPDSCGGVNVTAPRGGCPVGFHCTCPNGAYCFVPGECRPD